MKELVFNHRGLDKLQPSYWYYDEDTDAYKGVNTSENIQKCFDFKHARMYCENFLHAAEGVRNNFLSMGKALLNLKSEKLYRCIADGRNGGYGYRSFAKFVENVLGMSKSTAASLIAVYERFGEQDTLYAGYGYSQLLEMKDMDDGMEKLNPSVSVRQIRLLKEFYKNHGVPHETTVEADLREAAECRKQEHGGEAARRANLQFVPGDDTPGALTEAEVEGYEDEEEDEFHGAEEEPEYIKEAREAAHAAGLPFSSRPFNGPDDELNPMFFDGSMSVADYERMTELQAESAGTDAENVQTSGRFSGQNAIKKDETQAKERESAVDDNFAIDISVRLIGRKLDEIEKRRPSIKPFADVVKKSLKDGSCFQELSVKTVQSKLEKDTENYSVSLDLLNEKARKEWLEKYRTWRVWLDIPELDMKLYRYDFRNGDALIVTTYCTYWKFAEVKLASEERYCILSKDCPHYDLAGISKSLVLDYLTKHRNEL